MRALSRNNKRAGGFTLVELMVVVTIIAILASIALPKLNIYVRTAETSDASQVMGRIHSELVGYRDARQLDWATLNDIVSAENQLKPTDWTGTATGAGGTSGTGDLVTVLPQLKMSDEHEWAYVVTIDTTADEEGICIKATNLDGGYVAYSSRTVSASADNPDWEGHTSRVNYITDGDQDSTSGGNCRTLP